MQLRCPICFEGLDSSHVCANRHSFQCLNGVLALLNTSFGEKLQAFTAQLQRFRQAEGYRIENPKIYPHLPNALAHEVEWRLRGYDLTVIQHRLAGKINLSILEIGAWNGWLSHHLVKMGHQVTAVDYFTDPFDGLGAMQHYPTIWRAIQMDIEDLSIFIEPFDVVILNRCLQFFGDPAGYVEKAHPYVKPGGKMILTGLQFFIHPTKKARQVAAYRKDALEKYEFEIFLKPTKGYLDGDDKKRLQNLGLHLQPYSQTWKANLKALLCPSFPQHYFGIWK